MKIEINKEEEKVLINILNKAYFNNDYGNYLEDTNQTITEKDKEIIKGEKKEDKMIKRLLEILCKTK